jgi:tRNA(Arg) A34 adenosine deaminase TadA
MKSSKPEKRAELMGEAIRLSRKSLKASSPGGPFGAVIVKNGRIIGRGWNRVTSKNDPTAHAEVEAIRNACRNLGTFDLSGAEIYTSCEPCPMCLAAIYWAHLDHIYYANTRKDAARIGFDDDLIYHEIPKPLHRRKIPIEPCSRDEALDVFKKWQAKEDKTSY